MVLRFSSVWFKLSCCWLWILEANYVFQKRWAHFGLVPPECIYISLHFQAYWIVFHNEVVLMHKWCTLILDCLLIPCVSAITYVSFSQYHCNIVDVCHSHYVLKRLIWCFSLCFAKGLRILMVSARFESLSRG